MSLRQTIYLGITALMIMISIRIFIIEIFVVPTDSMSPTIQQGEKVIVNKMGFFIGIPARIPFIGRIISPVRFSIFAPQKKDIVVFFRNSQNNDVLYVKRMYATPHDTLQFNDSLLWIQSSRDSISYTKTQHFWMSQLQSSLTIPAKGDTLRINSSTIELYKYAIEQEGTKITILNNIVYFNGKPQNYYIVRNNYYFLIGDNAAHSYDSRSYGLIPENTIYGKPLFY